MSDTGSDDALKRRMQNRNRKKRDRHVDDSSSSRCSPASQSMQRSNNRSEDGGSEHGSTQSRRRSDDGSGVEDQKESGDSSQAGTAGVIPKPGRQQRKQRSARKAKSPPPVARANPDYFSNVAGMPHPVAAPAAHPFQGYESLEPDNLQGQDKLQGSQEVAGTTRQSYQDAAAHHLFLLQQQQHRERTFALLAAGNVGTHGAPVTSSRRNFPSIAPLNDQSTSRSNDPSTARLNDNSISNLSHSGSSSVGPHFHPPSNAAAPFARSNVAIDPSVLLALTSPSTLSSAQDALLRRHILLSTSSHAAMLAPSAPPPNGVSAAFPSTSQRLPGGRQQVALSRRPPPPPHNLPPTRTEEVFMSWDTNILSEHQAILRKQIQYFVAHQTDIDYFTPGRRKELSVGQVGIRCKHCQVLHPQNRPRGAVYFPSTLQAIYQAAQNMASVHLTDTCAYIDPQLKEQLIYLQEKKAVMGHGGKKYWAEAATARGIIETERGLRFKEE